MSISGKLNLHSYNSGCVAEEILMHDLFVVFNAGHARPVRKDFLSFEDPFDFIRVEDEQQVWMTNESSHFDDFPIIPVEGLRNFVQSREFKVTWKITKITTIITFSPRPIMLCHVWKQIYHGLFICQNLILK